MKSLNIIQARGSGAAGDPYALYRRHEDTVTGNYNRQSLGERVVKSRCASDDHHACLAEVTEECVNYMKCLSERAGKPAWASEFHKNTHQFCNLSKAQRLRGRLYAGPRLRERLNTYMQITGNGGYLGQPFHAMGMRGAVKDFLRVATGSSL